MGCEANMDIDMPPEVGPTEETVEALIEYLVGPLLPLKHSGTTKEIPSESLQKSVAKQVHAAAVLYNYYHLYRHREKEFLKFDQFCSLAIMFKPSILNHMKYMCTSDRPTLDDPKNQLSLTEKAIMDACNVSETLLDVSANASSSMINEWPITKVAVLLIDSKKENCFLQFNNGVWSVIEKDLFQEEKESNRGKKRKLGKYDAKEENRFQQLAFSAVKEVAGIVNGKLKVLESHVVYSLSQAKTATRFYILQSTQSISGDQLVPIQDVISSLKGPVVKKCSDSWVITPIVEYYYLLPYADIISNCFSRSSNSLLHQAEKITESRVLEAENSSGTDKALVFLQKEIQSSKMHTTPLKVYRHERRTTSKNMSTTKEGKEEKANGEKNSCIVSPPHENGTPTQDPSLVKEHHPTVDAMILEAARQPLLNKTPEHVKKVPAITEMIAEKTNVDKKEPPIVSPHVDETLAMELEPPQDFHSTMDSKKSELSEAALRALLNRRQKLCDQQRNIENELSLCDQKIQTIMHSGDGDYLSLKLEAVIDCCNEICKQGDTPPQHVSRSFPLSGKSLSNAQLTLRKACQELDDICLSNNWMLPTYHTSSSEGGFVANVTVKGTDFECLGVSGIQPSINEARNSAATHVITKLQQMAIDHSNALL